MKNDGEFAGDGNLGFADAASFSNAHAPGFERGPFRNARKQDIGSLEEIAAQ
ncbi:MAG: hypothetical protein JXQ99_27410 [Hyphomicrobiaceae bacterium]